MSRYNKIRCPHCGKVITESTLKYDFELKTPPTNRYFCSRCKKTSFYTVEQQNNNSLTAKAE